MRGDATPFSFEDAKKVVSPRAPPVLAGRSASPFLLDDLSRGPHPAPFRRNFLQCPIKFGGVQSG
jgi:hypothetical protein